MKASIIHKHIKLAIENLKYKITKRRKPLIVFFLVTNRCNLKCKHCFPNSPHRNIDDLPLKEILPLIDEMKKMGTQRITLLGGEPLLREDIGEIIKYITNKGILCDLITNGYFIEKKIDALKRLDSICISLDGAEDANDMIRGKGAYKKIIESIRAAQASGLSVRVSMILTPYNIDTFDEFIETAKKMNFSVYISFMGETPPDSDIYPEREKVQKFLKQLLIKKKEGYPISNTVESILYSINWPLEYTTIMYPENIPPDYKPVECVMGGRLFGYVDADGLVLPCSTLWRSKGGLNYRDVGFKRAWESLQNIDCVSCGHPNTVEWSLFFSSPRTIIHAVKRVWKITLMNKNKL